ncbi:hypothetical protein SAMN05444406_1563 [Caldicoprobacter faecalis]|uniref:Uncharacterized protein n=2 Tax=Caldicoprobacter faecalis TaxID=937334 RepID=A0A1I5YPB4_9FIRM|nr:hypothetical protein SAMN05444406_1563 [Caldicoprobacter faecalis]
MQRGYKIVAVLVFIVIAGVGIFTILSNAKNQENLPLIVQRPMPKSGSGGNFLSLTLDIPEPQFPEKMMVYKVIKPALTKEMIREQAAKLGVVGSVEETEVDFRVMAANGSIFSVDKETGSINFTTKEFETAVSPLKTVLSDEEYKKLALEFLTSCGLMKEEAEFRDVNKENTVTIVENGVEKKLPFMIEVRFGRKKDDIPWGGVGPKISVYFGENGKIIGAASVWREVEPFREYPIKEFSKALEDIKQGKATIYEALPNDSGKVKEVRLMYRLDPIGYQQEYVIPYFMVIGTNSKGTPFAAFTRAISEEYILEKPVPQVTAPATTK